MSDGRTTPEPPDLAGLVLAGGQSRRMQTDKAAIEVAGETMLARAVRILSSSLDAVYVGVREQQVNDALRSAYPQIHDDLRLEGPLASLLAAHEARPASAWLVVACDMPWLTPAVIQTLIAGRQPASAATAFATSGAPQPLCAIYEPANLARLAALAGMSPAPGPRWLLSGVAVEQLPAPGGNALDSVNRPADLTRSNPDEDVARTDGGERQGVRDKGIPT